VRRRGRGFCARTCAFARCTAARRRRVSAAAAAAATFEWSVLSNTVTLYTIEAPLHRVFLVGVRCFFVGVYCSDALYEALPRPRTPHNSCTDSDRFAGRIGCYPRTLPHATTSHKRRVHSRRFAQRFCACSQQPPYRPDRIEPCTYRSSRCCCLRLLACGRVDTNPLRGEGH
jgi:hypothetical protein